MRSTELRLSLISLALLVSLPAFSRGASGAQACDSKPGIIVFKDGTRMDVQCYALRGQVVILRSPDGALRSVARYLVDMGATEELNGNRTSPEPLEETATGRAAVGGERAPARQHKPRSGATAAKGKAPSMRRRASRPDAPALYVVGDDEEPTVSIAPSPSRPLAIDGPPPPEPPEVIRRDDEGRVTLRAVRLAEPLQLDGKLEESVYRRVPAITGFIQQEPHEGELATEQTEVWVLFDERNVYISARCWDSHPERIVANEMRRDNRNLHNNANFAVILDTFYDRRNGFLFYTNPLGGLYDGQVTDERNTNSDWNTVWEVKTGRFAKGWTVEMELPFKSLRYKPGRSQVWGINFRRTVRWKNEWSYLTPIAAAFRQRGLLKLSQAATLVGIEPPARSLNLEVKPYATGGLRTDLTADKPYSNDLDGDVGLDVKYGLSRSMVFDFTYNTDFAQVEIDEEQVNLTRFSLFFPEKRDFFLEGQGIFNFAGRTTRRFGGEQSDTPILFYSRRIGLQNRVGVPINVGGRLTGRAGDTTIGALAMQTAAVAGEEVPATSFGVLRLKRDVFRRSNIGFLGTYRSNAVDTAGSNAVFGVDANFTFFQNLNINTYWARSWTPDTTENDMSYMGRLNYGSDRYGLDLQHLVVQENFNPEVGFLRRDDMKRSYGKFRFSPRPRSLKAVRRFSFEGSLNYIADAAGNLETRTGQFQLRTELENGDFLNFEYTRTYDFLPEEFEISDGIVLPIGGYAFQNFEYSYRFGPQRRASGWVNFRHGSFYSGNRKEAGVWSRLEVTKQFSLEPRVSQNWVSLAEGDFTTTLLRLRADYMFTPRAFVGALLQFNSSNDSLSSNIRFRWEYIPGSDLYIVYSDGRDTSVGGFPLLENRSLVFKLTRLLRF